MAKRIITTLLALQLFVTAGLCAGLCCVTDFNPAEETAPRQIESNQDESGTKADSGHCPMHAVKSGEPKPQTYRQHPPNPGERLIAAQVRYHNAKSSLTVGARFCACNFKREEQTNGVLSESSSGQRPAIIVQSNASRFSHWLIDASPPQNISRHCFNSYSSPYLGSQLNLRI